MTNFSFLKRKKSTQNSETHESDHANDVKDTLALTRPADYKSSNKRGNFVKTLYAILISDKYDDVMTFHKIDAIVKDSSKFEKALLPLHHNHNVLKMFNDIMRNYSFLLSKASKNCRTHKLDYANDAKDALALAAKRKSQKQNFIKALHSSLIANKPNDAMSFANENAIVEDANILEKKCCHFIMVVISSESSFLV